MLDTLQSLSHLAGAWLSNPLHVYFLQLGINSLAQAFPKPRDNESRWYVLAFNLSHLAAHNWTLLNERAKAGVRDQVSGVSRATQFNADLFDEVARERDHAHLELVRAEAAKDALSKELDRLRGIATAHGVPPALVASGLKLPAAPGET